MRLMGSRCDNCEQVAGLASEVEWLKQVIQEASDLIDSGLLWKDIERGLDSEEENRVKEVRRKIKEALE